MFGFGSVKFMTPEGLFVAQPAIKKIKTKTRKQTINTNKAHGFKHRCSANRLPNGTKEFLHVGSASGLDEPAARRQQLVLTVEEVTGVSCVFFLIDSGIINSCQGAEQRLKGYK